MGTAGGTGTQVQKKPISLINSGSEQLKRGFNGVLGFINFPILKEEAISNKSMLEHVTVRY